MLHHLPLWSGKVKDALTRETSVKLEVSGHWLFCCCCCCCFPIWFLPELSCSCQVEAQLSKAQELQKNTEKKSQQVVIALRGKVDDATAENYAFSYVILENYENNEVG